MTSARYSVLNGLHQLDLTLLEILVVYTVKLNKWEKFVLPAQSHSLRFMTDLQH